MTTDLLERLQVSLGNDFLVERELGGGGMSRVFLAEERRFGRRVVVKVLSPEIATGLSADRFEREILVAAQLQDPRIVPLLRAGRVDDLPYYTMPYIEGPSLRERLTRSPLPLDEAIGILHDVALGLEYAHAHQVVHRDIKPENVLLSRRTAVVADFGLAKAITAATQTASASTLTLAESIVGTPAYMAPEQAAGGTVDSRTDLYAWGVMAYEMLASEHPFADRITPQAMVVAQIADQPMRLAARRPDLPAALTALVDDCMAKDPEQRPADATTLVKRLDAAMPASGHRRGPSRLQWATAVVIVGLLAAAGLWGYRHASDIRWARQDARPLAARLAASDFSLPAVAVLRRAQAYLPHDTAIAHALAANTRLVTITSSPPGASLAIQDYGTPDSGWVTLGATPITSARIPRGYLRWKVSKPGVGEFVSAPVSADTMDFPLGAVVGAPAGMVPVGADKWDAYIGTVGWMGPFALPAFFLDRFEVTNRQYQQFVDAGGYQNREYWSEPFIRDGRTLAWSQAMALFRDRAGRAGPSTWEGGHYPEGQADYPVSGISWYEAMAYAKFVGKSLPSFAQWYEAAPAAIARYVVGASNISRSGPAAVGTFRGLGPYGTYDMAGNVREWVLNALNADNRFILGGASSSPTYLYSEPASLPAFDRSASNGMRCVRNVTPLPPAAARAVRPVYRNFAAFHPATEAVFRAYRVMYADPQSPLNATDPTVVSETADWRKEKVSFDAAYNNERITAYLFVPKRVRPPYQTVVFFPSARVLDLSDSRTLGDTSFFDYVVQSGRAVLYPVYADTYERRVRNTLPGTGSLVVTVQRAQDLERSLDYLATRHDIAMDKLAYMGVSMGAAEGVIYATLAQDRLRTVVLLDGGYFLTPPVAGADQADFAPRLIRPVLMVNGRYDFSFPLEESQDPLFRMLGTPAGEKEHVVLDTPHDVRIDRPDLVRHVLSWLDRYLGPVE